MAAPLPPSAFRRVPRSARYRVSLGVRYDSPADAERTARTGSGRTCDLGLRGASLLLPQRVSPGRRIHVHCEDTALPLEVWGTVAWVARKPAPEGGILHGVSFDTVPARQRTVLEQFLADVPDAQSRVIPPAPVHGTLQCGARRLEVQLQDVSLSGACVEHDAVLPPGRLCRLGVRGPDAEFHIHARAVQSRLVGKGRTPTGEWRARYETGLVFAPGENASPALGRFLAHLAGSSTPDEL